MGVNDGWQQHEEQARREAKLHSSSGWPRHICRLRGACALKCSMVDLISGCGCRGSAARLRSEAAK
jgi:hypothetical protein